MPGCLHARRSRSLFHAAILVLPLALGASGGCDKKNSYNPSPASARQALEAALTAWQNGQRVGKIDSTDPPVQVVDSGWGKGQKLDSFEVLDEVSRPDGKRSFTVRLHLQKPKRTQEVHYVIVGISPLWVFREEDYKPSH